MRAHALIIIVLAASMLSCSESADQALLVETKQHYDAYMSAEMSSFHPDIPADMPIEDARRWNLAYMDRDLAAYFRSMLHRYPNAPPAARQKVERAEDLAEQSWLALRAVAEQQIDDRDDPARQAAHDAMKNLTVFMAEWDE